MNHSANQSHCFTTWESPVLLSFLFAYFHAVLMENSYLQNYEIYFSLHSVTQDLLQMYLTSFVSNMIKHQNKFLDNFIQIPKLTKLCAAVAQVFQKPGLNRSVTGSSSIAPSVVNFLKLASNTTLIYFISLFSCLQLSLSHSHDMPLSNIYSANIGWLVYGMFCLICFSLVVPSIAST